jgi:hypothetical protein
MFRINKDLCDQNSVFFILKLSYSCVVCCICFARKFMFWVLFCVAKCKVLRFLQLCEVASFCASD